MLLLKQRGLKTPWTNSLALYLHIYEYNFFQVPAVLKLHED